MARKKVGVLISGHGSNLQALIDACKSPDYPAEIVTVLSNKDSAYGLNRAAEADIATHVFNPKDYPSREAFDDVMHQMLLRYQVEIVCLAGYMRLLSREFVDRWQGRLINIHPSLLPAFKGAHAVKEALAAGVKTTGCTVHHVIHEIDAGPIIMQSEVPVLYTDTEDSLRLRIHTQEHIIYPKALKKLAETVLSS